MKLRKAKLQRYRLQVPGTSCGLQDTRYQLPDTSCSKLLTSKAATSKSS